MYIFNSNIKLVPKYLKPNYFSIPYLYINICSFCIFFNNYYLSSQNKRFFSLKPNHHDTNNFKRLKIILENPKPFTIACQNHATFVSNNMIRINRLIARGLPSPHSFICMNEENSLTLQFYQRIKQKQYKKKKILVR